jgi:thymidylate synthase ThyX
MEALVLADSIHDGHRLTTMQLTYPRILLPELNTHRVFSRSTQSNRAVSAKRLRRLVREYNYVPDFTGEQRGMSGKPGVPWGAKALWRVARECALALHWVGEHLGVHKQSVNRLLEPFQPCTTVVSSTEWDNFFKQRISMHAQPEMYQLAWHMKDAMLSSAPKELKESDWHLPYHDYYDHVPDAPMLSAARCARVSYLSKPNVEDLELAKRLQADGHWSPFEHVARPAAPGEDTRNFRGWVQLRSIIGG